MPSSVQFGQIIWAEVADANGVRKLRPAVVVTPNDRITASGPLEVVAVTSRLPQPLPADHVLLPWHARGHPRTGLNRKCAAVCSWLARIVPGDIQGVAGIAPGAVLSEIVARVHHRWKLASEDSLMSKKIDEIESLATWLYIAAQEAGQVAEVRALIRATWKVTEEMYGLPKDNEPDDPAYWPTHILSRFAAAWDEFDQQQRSTA